MTRAIMAPQPATQSGSWTFSDDARAVIAAVRRREGRQAILFSWPAGAAYLPARCYLPGPHDVMLGHVEHCAVYADARLLALFPSRRILVVAAPGSGSRSHPALRVRNLGGH